MNYEYTIQAGDYTQNLTLRDITSRVDSVYLDASVTTTLANLSLDHHGLQGKQLGANRSTEPIVVITDRAPVVSNCSFKDVVEDTKLVGRSDNSTMRLLFVRQCRGHSCIDAECEFGCRGAIPTR